MMDAKVEGTPFSVLMQQAVKLKTHIHRVDRVQFDRWPKFYQNSAFVKDEQRPERALPFAERMVVAKAYKRKGDENFRKDVLQSSLNYEWCAGLFKWATTLDANWRKKSLDDDDIEEEEFLGDTDEQRDEIKKLRLACYQNIARCYFKQKEYVTARQACDWALALDPTSDVALYLRATALTEPASSGTAERDEAIADLERAEVSLRDAEAAATSSERDSDAEQALESLSRRKRDVTRLLRELKRSRQLGKAADKAYGGMFERGEVYDGDEAARRKAPDVAALAASRPSPDDVSEPARPGDGRFSARPGPEAELAVCEQLAQEYEAAGRAKDADELRKGVDEAKRKLARARRARPPRMDFRNPTPEMAADAKRRGVDLDDPRVVAMLEELQDEQREGATPAGRAKAKRRDDARAEAARMSMSELLRALDAAGVPHAHCSTKAELQALYATAASDPEKARDTGARAPKRPAVAASSQWTTTTICAVVFIGYRLWSTGILAKLIGGDSVPVDDQRNPSLDAAEDPWGEDEF